ncbi:MAG TPA: VanW family protein, partial [Candidatus Paceibacterota bacterium]|nr:VanW family protein [Candidatus Paceibacterota bacterium]
GEEFSTVFSLGTTTEEEGFVKEFVIKEDKSVKELGGGLCQVATTMFRLALDAGLPITERTNHRYVVGYYGAGLDATIYDPHPDLRFKNDTGKYLLLQGTVKDNQLTFEFFGQKDGRQINISEPILSDEKPIPDTKYLMSTDVPYATMQCSETPRKGITAEVTYNVTYKEGKINEQKFKSVYQPWRKICLIGLATTTPNK